MKRSTLALVGLLLAGCGGPNRGEGYPPAFAEAERAEAAGRYAEAADRYGQAASMAGRDRDRDHARYLAAMARIRSGDLRRGIADLEALGDASPPGSIAASASYQAALSRIQAGDEARGYQRMEQVVLKFPSSGAAHMALRRWLANKDQKEGLAASLAWLRTASAGPLGSSALAERMAYEVAERQRALGDLPAARDAYLAVASQWPYPFGALFDDALVHASELDERLGRYPEAIAHRERLLREHEETTMVGTYQRPQMAPSLFHIAELYDEKLHDRGRARETYRRMHTEFPTSTLRDDALWREAQLWSADGNGGKTCDRLSELVREFPSSRYAPCAPRLCPSLSAPPKGAKASREPTCHDYLLSPVRGG